jgi:hypothetical protein
MKNTLREMFSVIISKQRIMMSFWDLNDYYLIIFCEKILIFRSRLGWEDVKVRNFLRKGFKIYKVKLCVYQRQKYSISSSQNGLKYSVWAAVWFLPSFLTLINNYFNINLSEFI